MVEFFESYAIWIILGLVFLVTLIMAPCHAVFLLPVAGLPLFWLLPVKYSLPINIAVWLATYFLYRLIRESMKKPVQNWFQSLLDTRAVVVSMGAPGRSAKYLVRAKGELWSAYSKDILEIGEQVNIVALKGIGVIVERAQPVSAFRETGSGQTTAS
ncbi:MAG: NfeD family protein, partial [Dehalococcoidia bacterium]|nr:NfeD family protein [Dehalococcoidia bacterium]